jgi:hypothetical protein
LVGGGDANLSCAKCGTQELVEMHHVRKLSDLNPKLSEVDRIMVKARRKQVPGWLPKGWFLPLT